MRLQVPNIPAVHDYQSLCDGVCLALFVSYYCPKALPWTLVRINYLPAVEDSVHNVSLVSNFCQKHLPYNVFHMNPEDVTYMRKYVHKYIDIKAYEVVRNCFNIFIFYYAVR